MDELSLIPKPLLEDIIEGKCLPFIGAGFSKNAELPKGQQMPNWTEIIEELAKILGSNSMDPLQVASNYAKTYGRPKLVETLERILHVDEVKPGDAHNLFVKLRSFNVICTTNFDKLLENAYAEQKIPFRSIASSKQISLWGGQRTVKILKMHGELPDLDIVFTKEDYDNYMTKYGAIAQQLQSLLSTMTPLFLGYSVTDPNFQQIKQVVDKLLDNSARMSYIVLLNADESEIEKYKKLNLHVIPLNSVSNSKKELLLNFLKELHEQIKSGITTNEVKVFTEQTIPQTTSKHTPENKTTIDESLQIKIHPISISVHCDKSVYPQNAMVHIRTRLNNIIQGQQIYIEVFNSNKKLLISKKINPNTSKNIIKKEGYLYQTSFEMQGSDWGIRDIYTIIVRHGLATSHDSFTIDRRQPIVQSDKSVYIFGSDIILSVIDPDQNYDSQKVETAGNIPNSLVTIESSLGKIKGYKLIETGKNTGIFQGILRLTPSRYIKNGRHKVWRAGGHGPFNGHIPAHRGEQIMINYSNDYNSALLTLYSSNFGATVELDSKNYRWKDMVTITVVAPDHNLNPNKVDTIGNKFDSKITISTSLGKISNYKLVETGNNTGIFTGYVTLIGPSQKISRKKKIKNTVRGNGPTNGLIQTAGSDKLIVTFESDAGTFHAYAKIMMEYPDSNYLTEDEFKQFLWGLERLEPFHSPSSRPPMSVTAFSILFTTRYECGLSISKAIKLIKSDLDLEHRIIKIKDVKTGTIQKTITSKLVIMLQAYTSDMKDNQLLFPVNRQTVWRYAKDAGRLAGLEIFS